VIEPKIPTVAELKPWLSRLDANPGSVVLIALESFDTRNDCRVTIGWLSKEERQSLKAGLERARRRRQVRKKPPRRANRTVFDLKNRSFNLTNSSQEPRFCEIV
jgi:hypothetical protein